MTPEQALDALLAAANGVAGLTAADADRLGSVALPAVLVGAPTLAWEAFCGDGGPTAATFPVTLLVRLEPGAIRRLLRFVADLQGALEDATAASVGEAVPLSYDLGEGVKAAAYELTIEHPL